MTTTQSRFRLIAIDCVGNSRNTRTYRLLLGRGYRAYTPIFQPLDEHGDACTDLVLPVIGFFPPGNQCSMDASTLGKSWLMDLCIHPLNLARWRCVRSCTPGFSHGYFYIDWLTVGNWDCFPLLLPSTVESLLLWFYYFRVLAYAQTVFIQNAHFVHRNFIPVGSGSTNSRQTYVRPTSLT